MPSTIPYSPSLTLGSVITPSVMEALTKISHAQAPIDAAQENLSSLISLRRSLDMTRQELVDMRISPAELDASLIKVNADIDAAASHYAAVRMTQEDALLELRTGMPPVMASPESPVDFNHERTQIKQVAIGADNLKLEVQYFSFNENAQDARNQLNKVRGFITATASTAGSDANGASLELANAATEQISQQISTHNIAGTLVVAASCTHRNASMLAPLYLDVDKAIRVWNQIYKSDDAKIRTDSKSLATIASEAGKPEEPAMHIISGASYGSSFIGMVHVLRSEDTTSFQSMQAQAGSLQASFKFELGLAGASGQTGIESNVASDIKRLFSGQQINAHVSLITTGVISGLAVNEVASAVKTFANIDPSKSMEALGKLADANASDKESSQSAAKAARSRQLMASMQAAKVEGVLSSLADIQGEKIKVMDVNSLMDAFDTYIANISNGKCTGVPINYFVKPITRSQLALMWVTKYFPGEFDARSGDDSELTKRIDPAAKDAQPNPAKK